MQDFDFAQIPVALLIFCFPFSPYFCQIVIGTLNCTCNIITFYQGQQQWKKKKTNPLYNSMKN